MMNNPNYNPNTPTYNFNDQEIIELRDTVLLYESVSSFELIEDLIIDLMENYNIKNEDELHNLIRPREVELKKCKSEELHFYK